MKGLPLGLGLVFCLGLAAACGDSESHPSKQAAAGTPSSEGGNGGVESSESAAGAGAKTSGGSAGSSGSGGNGGDQASAGFAGVSESGAGATSEGGAGGDAPAALTSAQFCDGFAARMCDWFKTCRKVTTCSAAGPIPVWLRECQDARASEAGLYVSFDAKQAEACIAAMANEGCMGNGPPFVHAAVAAACADVFIGEVATGKPCISADFANVYDECDTGYCNRTGPTALRLCPGTCNDYVQKDGDCTDGKRCALGWYCQDGTCGAARTVGQSCTNASCAAPLVCSGNPLTCREQKPIGGACKDQYDCEYPAVCVNEHCADHIDSGGPCVTTTTCKDGLYCKQDGQSQVCAARAAPNQVCDTPNVECEVGDVCSSTVPSTCVKAQGALDEACGPNGCEVGLWCHYTAPNTGKCLTQAPLDGACTETAGCTSGLYCVGNPGKCDPGGDEGAACSAADTPSCAGDPFCARDTLKCTKRRAKGETCNPIEPLGSCQDGLYCACLSSACPATSTGHNADDVCAEQRANGADCTNYFECLSKYCDGNKCAAVPPNNTCSR